MTKTIAIRFTPAQAEYLRGWGLDAGYTSDTEIIRVILREKFGDSFPADPPAPGGTRYTPPLPNTNVVLKTAFNGLREGAVGVFEKRTRHGGLVRFGDVKEPILVPYRLLRSEGESGDE